MRLITLKKCNWIHVLYFAADGSRLFAVGGSSSYYATSGVSIDAASGAEIGRVYFSDPTCYNVDPAINRLVIGEGYTDDAGNATVQWIGVPGASEWNELEMEGAASIGDVAFDHAGERLAVTTAPLGRGKCKVDVFRFALGEQPKHLISMPTKRLAGFIAFSYDGKRLALGAGLGGVDAFEVFDLASGELVFQFNPKVEDRRCVRFLPDGRIAAAGGSKVYILPPDGGRPQFVLATREKALVNDIAVAANGRLFAAMSNGKVRVWDTITGKPGPTYSWKVGGVGSVALAPDGLTCAATGSKGRIVVWDVDS